MTRLSLLDRLELGDHACWTVNDEVVRRRSLTDVVQAGLRERHRVVYCGDDTGEVLAAFEHLGLRVGEALASGDLRVPPVESSYLTAGAFDPATALCFLRREIDAARHAGYLGLRLLTDMSWASRPGPGIEGLPRYEAEANTIFVEGYALAVCAYDPQNFEALSLRGLTQAHPSSVETFAPFDPGFVLRIRRTLQPFGLRLEGEADLSNRSALSAVVNHLLDIMPAGDATATIDLSDLRFIDTASARILLRASDRAAGRLRFVGQPLAIAGLLRLNSLGEPAGTA